MSIRFLIVLTTCIAIATWWLGSLTTSRFVQTTDHKHLAIAGDGFFRVMDEEKCETRYTRCGRLEVDQDNELSIRIDEQLWQIDPPMIIPPATRQLEVSPDGHVRAQTSAGSKLIGRLQMAHFHCETPFDRPFLANNGSIGRTGTEDVREPSKKNGWIRQGFLELPPPNMGTITIAYGIALVSSYLLSNVGWVKEALRRTPGT